MSESCQGEMVEKDTDEFPPAGNVSEPPQAPPPYSSLVRLDFGALTNVGKIRANNEDAYVIFRTGRYWEKVFTNLSDGELPDRHEENGYVMAVADGMGGMAGGEVASRLSLRTGIHLVLHAVKWGLKLDHPEERGKEIEEGIRRVTEYFDKINRVLAEQARTDPSLRGMGTTLTVSYSFGDDLFLFHVGDSRAYLFRAGRLKQLTRDHTMAQAMLDAGVIAPAELPGHRLRHVLTQALGTEEDRIQTEVHQLQLADGDCLLLCSDGLYEMVDDASIARVLAQGLSAQEACRALVDEALQGGGKDNVTVLVARYTLPPRA